tara:strand:+ start:325 stop:483 length:159 start_codon:yes stop_codon:yes gene_type:complete
VIINYAWAVVAIFILFFFSSLTFSNMVWITNPDVGERRKRRRLGMKNSEEKR